MKFSFRSLADGVRNVVRRYTGAYVLVADDDEDVRVLCTTALKRAGYAVDIAANGREAREKLEHNKYSAVLLDMGMPYLHGATLISILQREEPEMLRRVIIVTGMSDQVLVDVGPRVAAVLRKPLNLDMIVSAVRDCCQKDDTLISRPS